MTPEVIGNATLYLGDVLEGLAQLEDESVHTCITSPPYWGLRDYGVEGQIGLEPTLGEFLDRLVAVFEEVRRVLRSDGTAWVNMGDAYVARPNGGVGHNSTINGQQSQVEYRAAQAHRGGKRPAQAALKYKDLIGQPWRLAFALQADGWTLRQEIIWSKPNPMPESVRDRCTKAHEQIFLFSKAKWVGAPPGRFDHISDQDARWLALLIDTEGSIVVKRAKHEGRGDTFAPQVSVGNTNRALLEEVVRIVGHGNLLERPGKNYPMLYWQLGNGLARDFLYRIYPFLIVKRRQARIAIHVDDLTYYRGGKRPERKNRTEAETAKLVSLWERNKACNHFGEPDLSDVPEPDYGRWTSQPYYFDQEAIKEPAGWDPSASKMPDGWATHEGGHGSFHRDGREKGRRSGNKERKPASARGVPGTPSGGGSGGGVAGSVPREGESRNKRSVWTVPTRPFPEAHFATFPPDLIRPCVLAGAPEGGVVLDPFAGSGTTGVVALEHGRRFVGIELNPEYMAMVRRRCAEAQQQARLFA